MSTSQSKTFHLFSNEQDEIRCFGKTLITLGFIGTAAQAVVQDDHLSVLTHAITVVLLGAAIWLIGFIFSLGNARRKERTKQPERYVPGSTKIKRTKHRRRGRQVRS